MKNNRYTEEFYAWLANNYKGSRAKMIEKIQQQFGYNMNFKKLQNQIWIARKKYNIPELNSEGRPKSKDGAIHKRINGDCIRENGKLKLYYRYVWEQANGKIPKNCCIIHIDGNRANNDISNLYMITKIQNAYINSNHLAYNNLEELKICLLMSDISIIKPHYVRPSRRKKQSVGDDKKW